MEHVAYQKFSQISRVLRHVVVVLAGCGGAALRREGEVTR